MNGDGTTKTRGGCLHLGTTRKQVRCTCAEGHVFTVTIHTAIDIDSNPEVLDQLTDKGLQPVACPECDAKWPLAEPLVLHAREGGRLALFVPEPLAHRELHLRAELMREVAEADPARTPSYIADFQTLVGSRALKYWLFGPSARALTTVPPEQPPVEEPEPPEPSAPTPEPSPPQRVSAPRIKPAIHEAFADLMGPEVRTSTIPPELDMDDADDEDPLLDEDWLDDDSLGASHSGPVARASTSRPPGERHAEPPPAVEQDEPRKTKPSQNPSKNVDFAGLLSEEEDSGEFLLEDEDLDENDDGFGLEDEEEVFGGGIREASREPNAATVRSFEVIGDQVILQHRVDATEAALYDPASADLWIQLHSIDGFPLVLMTLLADPKTPKTKRLWWPLDLRREPHREVMHTLRRTFRAEVRLVDQHLETLSSFEIGGKRELNAAVVLKRATHAFEDLPPDGELFQAAVKAVGSLPRPLGTEPPPPLHQNRLPRPNGNDDLTQQLETLAEWTTGQRRDELVLVRSFPLDHLEAIVAELVGAAVENGVSLPHALVERAELIRVRREPADHE